MSKRKKTPGAGPMLDLWRPPEGAGDPIGCLATTYTFAPGLFDEQCLARFLEIESEPNREDLAFLLERETRLGSVYAGVLVDHTQAGVEHSLRWDVLPVRVRAGKQHAKVSLLAWTRHIRIIVASANLTEPGYRTNFEVAAAVDLTPNEAKADLLGEAVGFLRNLLRLVPGASMDPPEIPRAAAFLDHVERQARSWTPTRQGGSVRQHLVFTLPAAQQGQAARSSLESTIEACRGRGGSPREAWVASPFFDVDSDTSRVTASLCKLMARGGRRDVCFCVPEVREETTTAVRRLAAPKALLTTPRTYQGSVTVETLPDVDADGNRRPWHAKMLALFADKYTALMIGSSNFTCAGMGVGQSRNAEANLLTIVERVAYGRGAGELEAVWPKTEPVDEPESAEWLGARPAQEEEEQAVALPLPAGFLSATYRAGDKRQIVLRLDEAHLPKDWRVHACGQAERELLSSPAWHRRGRPVLIELSWEPVQPPEKLLVQWDDHEAFLPLNVEDSHHLPPPAQLEHMSADDMLWILAAADPSAAFRAWTRTQHPSELFDADLDSATPIDLDPLRRYDLQATFLHRIRRRARILAQLRSNLQRPVWGRQALEWRLRGLIGIEPLADRLVREFVSADGAADEALLTLADFLIVLREVDYQPSDGSLSKGEFEAVFRPFLRELAGRLGQQIDTHRNRISKDMMRFWERVVERCRA
jgi:hypothetical protein